MPIAPGDPVGPVAPTASIGAMYQEALLAHYRAPHNRRELPDATGVATHRNPVCGDEIRVMVRLDGHRVVDVAFSGRGCSIATASASMMTEAVTGRTVREAMAVADAVDRMLAGGEEGALPVSLTPLLGVAPFAGRHGCARMPWQALRDAVHGGSG
ncbi:MAG: Fe-S cluster assembly sulfur transfer protein SufU [Gemmatimonas sp.]|uniref:Fe-S cluster assembly sulfur transfer protein SufU n=1 Tax=Gemmatimonas sp. TaxID=1962908 RepID=UPI00391FBE79|nr:SUF system NifU family Fe-S cluster assembly protein [Gemmatimonadota bacterium]